MISAMMPTEGQAFSDSDYKSTTTQFGKCAILIRIEPSTPFAGVNVREDGGVTEFAEGAYWFGGNKHTHYSSISAAHLATCLESDASKFTNIQQTGADVSLSDDTYIGFSFTLTQGNEYFQAGDFEFSSAHTTITTPPDTTAPVLSAPMGQSLRATPNATTASLDVTSLGSVSDDVDTSVSITYKIGSTTLTGAYDFPLGETTVTMDAQDTAGNDAVQVSFTVTVTEGTSPNVVISGAPERLDNTESFGLTVTFSESVMGFEASDITASNATITGLSGTGAIYNATITPAGSGDVSLSVAAGAAEDAAGNLTTASNTVVVASTTADDTQKTIVSFLYSRANLLIANQPDLSGFLGAVSGSSLNAAVTRGQGHFDMSYSANRNVWFRLKGAWSEDGTADSRTVFGAFGGHIQLRETVLLGAMLQLDHLSQDDGASNLEGTGWLIGPYVVAKLPGDPLYFEGSLLYGQSSNSVSPFGTYKDNFDTTRMLAQLKVTGEIFSDETVFSPYLNLAYLKEDQDGYTDSLGNAISAQSMDMMQVAFGLDVAHAIAVQSGDLTLRGGISGIWSSTGGTAVAATVLPGYAGWRGKVTAGVSYVNNRNGTLTASTFLDGLGTPTYQSYGVDIRYTLAF